MTKKQKCLIPALLLGALILGGCGQTTNSSSNTSSSDAPSSSSSSSKGGSSSSSTSATVTSIAVVEGLNASYQQNVSVDLANVVVKATYSDATSKNVKQADGVTFSVSKVDTSVVGENFSFTISFGGKSVVWTYAVIAQATPSNVLIKSGLATSYSLNDVVDISAITATVTYSDGSSKDVNQGTGLTFSVTSIDTSTLGTFQFTYSFEKVSGNWEYTVNSWTIATFDNPDFVSKWEAAKSATGDYGYSRTTDAFTVGNINAFKFLPEMTAVDPKTKKPVSISAYHSNSTLEILGSDGTTYTVLDAQTLGTYCSINEFTSTYQFTASAIGHSFRLTVKPVTDASEDFSLTFNFAVADGYNVYSAKDLAVLAQRGFDARFVDATSTMTAEQVKAKMWLDFRTQKGIPELPKLAGVYFMNDIKLNHDDFPADCFWTAESLTNFSDFKNSGMDFSKFVFYKHVSSEGVITYTTENNGGDKLSLIGSIKDGNIITWQNAESHSFTMMGNYFSLDATTDSSFRMIIDSEHGEEEPLRPIKDKVSLGIALGCLGGCIVALAISNYIHLEMYLLAAGFMAVDLLALMIVGLVRKDLHIFPKMAKRVPYEVIPFVLSMFAFVLALNNYGVTANIANWLDGDPSLLKYGLASFLTCDLINNIPMSVLFSSIVSVNGTNLGNVYACIAGSNLGALLTPIGALAGIMGPRTIF